MAEQIVGGRDVAVLQGLADRARRDLLPGAGDGRDEGASDALPAAKFLKAGGSALARPPEVKVLPDGDAGRTKIAHEEVGDEFLRA